MRLFARLKLLLCRLELLLRRLEQALQRLKLGDETIDVDPSLEKILFQSLDHVHACQTTETSWFQLPQFSWIFPKIGSPSGTLRSRFHHPVELTATIWPTERKA